MYNLCTLLRPLSLRDSDFFGVLKDVVVLPTLTILQALCTWHFHFVRMRKYHVVFSLRFLKYCKNGFWTMLGPHLKTLGPGASLVGSTLIVFYRSIGTWHFSFDRMGNIM